MFHSCSLVFIRVLFVFTRVHSCSIRVPLVFIRVPLVFTRVHSCSFVFIRVHSCSDLCGVLDMIAIKIKNALDNVEIACMQPDIIFRD